MTGNSFEMVNFCMANFYCLNIINYKIEVLIFKVEQYFTIKWFMTYLYWSIHTLTKLKRQKYRIRVRATDRGIPKLSADVDVELDVVDRNNRPPIWDQPAVGAPISPIYVKENAPQGHVVTTVRARFVHKNATKKEK